LQGVIVKIILLVKVAPAGMADEKTGLKGDRERSLKSRVPSCRVRNTVNEPCSQAGERSIQTDSPGMTFLHAVIGEITVIRIARSRSTRNPLACRY
jgi:hypothetical protein